MSIGSLGIKLNPNKEYDEKNHPLYYFVIIYFGFDRL